MEFLLILKKYLPLFWDKKEKIIFDLQLFAGEKTEEATPKRKEDARKKGQVAKSIEINSALIILVAFYFLDLYGSVMIKEMKSVMRYMFTQSSTISLNIENINSLIMFLILTFLKIVLPMMLMIAVIGIAINYFQVGFMFNMSLLMPDINRVNPISGFARVFLSKTALANLAKALLKILIIGYFMYLFISKQMYILPKMFSNDVNNSAAFFGQLVIDLGLRVGGVMLVIALFDYYYQWYTHKESIKMSKQEVKEEYKQTEGNPQIKSKIRAKQREMAMRRMMQEVPKADVVITNPTHFAVALKYENGMPAPILVAKGQDNIALKIRQVAQDNNVVVLENKTLARALYATVEIGSYIPFELYQAVAEVLAYVYKLKRRLA